MSKQEPWNSALKLGNIAFDVIRNDFHKPIKNGKCNRESVEDNILEGVYSGHLPAMNEADVSFVCDVIDDLILSQCKK